MNIFKNLMFLQGHFVDPHMDEDYGQTYGAHAQPHPPARSVEPKLDRDGADATRTDAFAATPAAIVSRAREAAPTENQGDIQYLDVYYTSR